MYHTANMLTIQSFMRYLEDKYNVRYMNDTYQILDINDVNPKYLSNVTKTDKEICVDIVKINNTYYNAIILDKQNMSFDRFEVLGDLKYNKLYDNTNVDNGLSEECYNFGYKYQNVNHIDIFEITRYNREYDVKDIGFYMSLWYLEFKIRHINITKRNLDSIFNEIYHKSFYEKNSILLDTVRYITNIKMNTLKHIEDDILVKSKVKSLLMLYNIHSTDIKDKVERWINILEYDLVYHENVFNFINDIK